MLHEKQKKWKHVNFEKPFNYHSDKVVLRMRPYRYIMKVSWKQWNLFYLQQPIKLHLMETPNLNCTFFKILEYCFYFPNHCDGNAALNVYE